MSRVAVQHVIDALRLEARLLPSSFSHTPIADALASVADRLQEHGLERPPTAPPPPLGAPAVSAEPPSAAEPDEAGRRGPRVRCHRRWEQWEDRLVRYIDALIDLGISFEAACTFVTIITERSVSAVQARYYDLRSG